QRWRRPSPPDRVEWRRCSCMPFISGERGAVRSTVGVGAGVDGAAAEGALDPSRAPRGALRVRAVAASGDRPFGIEITTSLAVSRFRDPWPMLYVDRRKTNHMVSL